MAGQASMTETEAGSFLGPETTAAPTAAPAGSMSAHDADTFLGPAGPAPTAAPQPSFGNFASGILPASSPERDAELANNPVGRVLDAFGQGAADSWGTDSLGLSDDTVSALRKAKVFPDLQGGQTEILRAFNEALMRPAAALLDAGMRAGSAVIGGAQAGVAQAGAEAGLPELGRDVASIPDVFQQEAFGAKGVLTGANDLTLADLHAAADAGEIGSRVAVEPPRIGGMPSLEAAPESAIPPPIPADNPPLPPEEPAVSAAPVEPAAATPAEPAAPAAEAAPPPPADAHALARSLDPATFDEFDTLSAHRDDLRGQIAQQQADLQANATAQAPGAAELANLQDRIQDTTPRLAKKYQARIDALQGPHDDFLQDDFTMGALTRDTPEIAAMRQSLAETDYRMRDLSPAVTEAYRQARLSFPEDLQALSEDRAPPAAPAQAAASEAAPAAEPAPSEPMTPAEQLPAMSGIIENPARDNAAANPDNPAAAPAPGPAAVSTPAPVVKDIAADVTSRLVAAGRPAEEAEASGKLIEAYWQTRARAFDGTRGTAQEMYAGEAPAVKQGQPATARGRARVTEMAQQGRSLNQPIRRILPADNLKQGVLNAARALDEKTSIPGAMYREDIGDITFDYGKPGRADRRFSGGFGLSHIMARRQLEGIDGNAFVRQRVPEVLASGRLERLYGPPLGRRADIVLGGDQVTLSLMRHGDRESWVVTAFKREAGSGEAAGVNPDAPYAPTPSGMQAAEGAEPGVNIGQTGGKGSREFEQGAQGKIRIIDGARSTITLMKTANASTFMHETAHDWLERMMADAVHPAAPQAMRNDAATVRDYLGVNEGDRIPTKGHEKFARSFERYLMEGRAPSSALADVFAKFKGWLTTIYQTVSNLRAPINPDIRDVFDRLLSSKPERAEAPAAAEPEVAPAAEPEPVRAEPAATPVTIVPDRPEDAATPLADAAQARAATPARAKPTDLYPTPPKEPERLVNYIRRMGGIQDPGGDVRHTLGGAKYRPGLINNTNGKTLDYMAMQAWEKGYFPQHAERPDVNALLDAINEDLGGNPQYSKNDWAEAEAHHAAVARNDEIDRLAQEHGIDTTGMTRGDFFDAMAERMSYEEQANEIESLTTSISAEYDDLAAAAEEWHENYGGLDEHEDEAEEPGDPRGPFNSDEFLGIDDGPRSADELEHGFDGQAEAARPAGQGQADGSDADAAAGSSQQGAGDRQQSGRGAGDARGDDEAGAGRSSDAGSATAEGRAGDQAGRPGGNDTAATGANPGASITATAAAERPTTPGQAFGRSDTGLVDRAGNIRLDNLNTSSDIEQVIRDTADANDGFSDVRGPVSDAAVLDLADAAGVPASALDRSRLGEAYTAPQIVALRKLLVQSATAVKDAMDKAAVGSDADVLAYGEAVARHQLIQEKVASVTAEAGRALRAFRMLGSDGGDVAAVNEFLKTTTGRTLNQMRAEAQLGAQLDSPLQVSKFVADSTRPDFWDKVVEYWTNGLISGPQTHMAYAVGNQMLALWKAVPETAAAAAVGSVRAALGDTGARVRWGEVGSQMHGILFGQRDGFQAFVAALKSGATEALPGEDAGAAQRSFLAMQPRDGGAIGGPLGQVARLPSRGVAALHSYFRTIGYEQAMAALAYRTAASEGLKVDAFAQRVADLTTNPPPELMAQAVDQATTQTLMGEGGEFTKTLATLSNRRVLGVPMVKFVLPFVKIGANVAGEALLERSPLGLAEAALNKDSTIRANLMGRNGPVARDQQMSRIAVGSALGATFFGLQAQGLVTGSGPTDPREAALWRMSGKQAYSINVGGVWHSYHKFGPLGLVPGVAADLGEFGDHLEQGGADKVTGLMALSIVRNVLDEGWMRGVSSMIQAVTQPEQYGAKYVRDQAASFVPFSVGMGQVARAIDPYSRQARTITDAVMAKVPGLSMSLMPRYDIFGQPITNSGAVPRAGDPAVLALQRASVFPAAPERRLSGVTLTDQEYDDYSRLSGRMVKQRLDGIVASPGFAQLPLGVQARVLGETISHARSTAGELIKMRNPAIIRQAMQNRLTTMTQGKAAAVALPSLN